MSELSDLADAIRHQTNAINALAESNQALIESNQAMLDYIISLEADEEEDDTPQAMYLDGGVY